MRPVVVLPHPLSPTRPSVSPLRTAKLTPSTARTWPTVLRNSPFSIGKCFFNPSTDNRRCGSPSAWLMRPAPGGYVANGSTASRMASPRKLKQSTVTVIINPGIVSQTWRTMAWMLVASLISTPQLVMGGVTPTPR